MDVNIGSVPLMKWCRGFINPEHSQHWWFTATTFGAATYPGGGGVVSITITWLMTINLIEPILLCCWSVEVVLCLKTWQSSDGSLLLWWLNVTLAQATRCTSMLIGWIYSVNKDVCTVSTHFTYSILLSLFVKVLCEVFQLPGKYILCTYQSGFPLDFKIRGGTMIWNDEIYFFGKDYPLSSLSLCTPWIFLQRVHTHFRG